MTTLATKARKRKPVDRSEHYRQSVRSPVYGLWRGALDVGEFLESMSLSIESYFRIAWYEGMASCGLSPADMTQEEENRLAQEITSEISYLNKYAVAIAENSKTQGGKLRDLTGRIPMWVNRYVGVRELAKLYACGDQKYRWDMGPTREHCHDCQMLSGRIYRASVWKASGWEPRSRDLACGGYKCLCTLTPTTLPATPGTPPRRI